MIRRAVPVFLVLLVAGLGLGRLAEPAWAEQVRRQPALQWRSLEGAAGQGVVLGLLGGFRALAADLLWLRANAAWERCDSVGTQAALELVTAVDPRPVAFWVNGARMIGHDMPYWRIDRAGGEGAVPAGVAERVFAAQARAAIAYLEKGFANHPDEPLLHIEVANLQLQRLGDLPGATEHYRLAARQPAAPFYAARVYAELLRRGGRDREALEHLVALHPTLPRENPFALADEVLWRIRGLEERLALPAAERYQPGRQ